MTIHRPPWENGEIDPVPEPGTLDVSGELFVGPGTGGPTEVVSTGTGTASGHPSATPSSAGVGPGGPHALPDGTPGYLPAGHPDNPINWVDPTDTVGGGYDIGTGNPHALPDGTPGYLPAGHPDNPINWPSLPSESARPAGDFSGIGSVPTGQSSITLFSPASPLGLNAWHDLPSSILSPTMTPMMFGSEIPPFTPVVWGGQRWWWNPFAGSGGSGAWELVPSNFTGTGIPPHVPYKPVRFGDVMCYWDPRAKRWRVVPSYVLNMGLTDSEIQSVLDSLASAASQPKHPNESLLEDTINTYEQLLAVSEAYIEEHQEAYDATKGYLAAHPDASIDVDVLNSVAEFERTRDSIPKIKEMIVKFKKWLKEAVASRPPRAAAPKRDAHGRWR
jgi:hypothetical protein